MNIEHKAIDLILRVLRDGQPRTTQELCDAIGMPGNRAVVLDALGSLKARGWVRRDGMGPAGTWVRVPYEERRVEP